MSPTETLNRALRSANVATGAAEEIGRQAAASHQVGQSLAAELRRLGAARLDADADFDAERFPDAERCFRRPQP